eukprot:CAMPEP_0183339712 /NCGR_PEP_ID=MMETSP0164_2-20130417/6540_1 /TAXON_ID=221442 /ORGANISM="Coccolithus pelagicus ssp braarudi, Strain PLY182g" /LENGTH=131 /DNA_ID=CAMNT_0025509759 /DNA_START=47 /DNA_END=442 /DNA_ORIENTATION=-
MSAQTDGLADLAGEVMVQLAASREDDDTRRPWIRLSSGGNGGEPIFLGMQHNDGRATWVVKHHGEKAVRFAIGDEKVVIALLVRASLRNTISRLAHAELVHFNHVLMNTHVGIDNPCSILDSMMAIVKSAI